MKTTAEVIQFQKKQEAKYICSACGADRVCNCAAPAVEKLADKMEQDRQRARRAYEKKKAEQNQTPSHVRNGNAVDPEEFAERREAAAGEPEPATTADGGAPSTWVRIMREQKELTRSISRNSKNNKFSDKDLKWLAGEAMEAASAWSALENELMAHTTEGKEQVAELRERAEAKGFKLQKAGIDQYRLESKKDEDDGQCGNVVRHGARTSRSS